MLLYVIMAQKIEETIGLTLHSAHIAPTPDQVVTFGLLTGITRADGSSLRSLIAPHLLTGTQVTGETRNETITLPHDKAERFVAMFKRFNIGPHTLDCHDFVIGVEGWEGEITIDNRIIRDGEQLEPGAAHQIIVNAGTDTHPDWLLTHSALSTNEGRLLSAMGEGLPIASLDRDTAKQVYGHGNPSELATMSLAAGDEPRVLPPL